MSLVSTDAIVLKSINFGESHKIVTFFTNEFGKLKIVVKGAYNLKNKFGASLEPMALTHIVFYDRPAKDLQLLSQSNLIDSFRNIRNDFALISWGCYLLELLDELTADRDKSKPLFLLLKNTLSCFGKASDSKLLVKYFELNLFNISGYSLQLKNCVICGKPYVFDKNTCTISVLKGGIVCNICKNILSENISEISGETLKLLEIIPNLEINKVERLIISQRAIKELDMIIDYFRKKYINKELKSLKFISKTI